TTGPGRGDSMMARSSTSGRITMPGPPPNGASSTVRCLSRANLRMSTVSSRQSPSPRALPASEQPSGPGNISGNSVITVAVQTKFLTLILVARRVGRGRLEQSFRRVDHQLARLEIHDRHHAVGEWHHDRRASLPPHLQARAGAVIVHPHHLAPHRTAPDFSPPSTQVIPVELAVFGSRERRASHEELRALERRRGIAIPDPFDLRQHCTARLPHYLQRQPALAALVLEGPVPGDIL